MRDLLLAVPSRGRPVNISRLLGELREHNRGDTQLVLGLDEDDPTLPQYLALDMPDVEVVIRPNLHQVVAWMNELIVPRAKDYRFVGSIGCDNSIQTPGWDVRIMEALSKPDIMFAFGNDLYPREPGSLCCHVFCRSSVVASLGYFAWPGVTHMYCDPIWMAWGKATGIEYLDDVIIEHLHYSVGKAAMDVSYMDSTALIPADCLAYNRYCQTQLNEDIAKIRAGAQGFTEDELIRFNYDLNIPPVFGGPKIEPRS